jgi:hypothetical protein
MSSNVVNQQPYLRTSRNFPTEIDQLCVEVNRSYVDIATKMNDRTISIFPTNQSAINGEQWFFNNQKMQGLRQVYQFGAISPGTELDIPTNITTGILMYTRIYGTVITTNGTGGKPDNRPLPYVDPSNVTVSMAVLVGLVSGAQQIRVVLGAAAPPVSSGIVVLEWISNV